MKLCAVQGRSGPSAFSRIASARSKRGRAAGEVALDLKQEGEIVKALCCIGMLRVQNLLAYRQGALIERTRPEIVALGVKQEGEVVEARRRTGMLRAERFLVDRERTLEEWPRLREAVLRSFRPS